MSKFLSLDGVLYLWGKVINKVNGKLDKTGGTLTGDLTLKGAPTIDLHAATKKSVDDSVGNAGGGDMLKSVYDTTNNGIVDNAEKIGGFTAALAFAAGEIGCWQADGKYYKAKNNGTVWTPAQYPAAWEVWNG